MDRLNYHHLHYFWTVARTGSMARAAEELGVSLATVSAQVHELEESLAVKLVDRVGRNVVPSEAGQLVYRYAEEIFGLGRELESALRARPAGPPARFSLGVSDALPKVTATRLLAPALGLLESHRLVLRVDKTDRLVGDLAMGALDLVLADAPVSNTVKVRAFNHVLGECGVTVFALPEVAPRFRRNFPRSLHGAPLVLQTENTALRRSLDAWFAAQGIAPRVVAEVEDVAILQTLGAEGLGLFAAPSLVEEEIKRAYGVRAVGRLPDVRERFFGIATEKRPRHPAVLAIIDGARGRFAD